MPEATGKPVVPAARMKRQPSGLVRFSVQMPPVLVARIDRVAKKNGRRRVGEINKAVEAWIEAQTAEA